MIYLFHLIGTQEYFNYTMTASINESSKHTRVSQWLAPKLQHIRTDIE